MLNLDSFLFEIPIVNSIIVYDETDSTNTRAKIFGKNGCVDGTLVIADMQTKGKGRLGRSFASPREEGIYMSLLLRPSIPLSRFPQITLLAAYALAKSLTVYPGLNPKIKWPNDIVINGKKIVGILTESDSENQFAVLGIGINVNNEKLPDEIRETSSSLYLEYGKKFDRYTLIKAFLSEFDRIYRCFLKEGNLAFLQDEYNRFLFGFNEEIFLIPHDRTQATSNPYLVDTSDLTACLCMGIHSTGNLICRQKDGSVITVNSGEVSVRGHKGYAAN